MSLFDSAKSVAKTFSENLREEAETTPTAPDQSLIERGKDLANTVKRAADKTLEDDSFAAAKEEVTHVVQETKEEITQRFQEVREQLANKREDLESQAEEAKEVIEGEIVSEDELHKDN